MNHKDVVALVTGGASGLGEASILELVKKGAKVVVIDVDADKGEKLAANIGADAIFVKTDVTSETDVRQTIQKAVDTFGKINVVINCAGVVNPGKLIGRKGPLPLDAFNKVLQINLVGTLNVIRLAVEQMMNNKPDEDGEKGVIINTASIAAFEGQIGQVAYSASKAGIVGMTLPIAREISDYGIRIVTIAPGIFETPMMAGLPSAVKEDMAKTVPFPRRLGKPLEFAKMVLHIIDNVMMNGCCVRLDGALRMPPK
ncbi:MAG: 3-hydroxyacyl-CoA dehydrogenase [Deltaproteobacteria bacterium HGW-Deltaproteobacteria-2]|jgi:NAD(P)-dependent dehydrogenase (short-subunit alcohol dehydrogenase family)|nr:MAG: 3-hydroxyacyl-CoA dehydrogenase [Deltaproteobacteria bacterium HGW-Deltaproteobacteria-2]